MLGKYQLIAEIARGGMGVVYLAMVQGPGGFNKLVVVKELKPELVEEPAFLMMFLDEARLAARLSHPSIVQTNEVGNDGDRYFMAMDYLDGRGLDHVRRRTRTAGFGLTQAMHLRVLCDVLSGLDYAHKLTDFDGTPLNIVHRDVSPQNVFLTFDGQVKLLDFGIAKASDSMHETHAGVVKGKVSYMSPEQGRGQKVDARADVFSAGVLMWEALTGKRMRDGKNEQEKLWALASEDIPRISTIKPTIPKELDDICYRAMAWNRDDRYASAGAMKKDIERYLTQSGTAVTTAEVGECVSSLFKDDRVNTNNVIEAYVARARQGAGRDQLPVIDVVRMGGVPGMPTPSGERMHSGERALTSSASHSHISGSHSISSSHLSSSHRAERGGITSLDLPNPRTTGGAGQIANMPQITIEHPRSKKLVVPAIAAVVVAAVVIFFVARSGHEARPTQLADAGRTPVATPPP
ncbi:MAG TPA: serine/threonine-protein kinase, partial [Kofleriaceae bacterium]